MCLFPRKGFPCGKCVECLSKKRDDWSIRLQFEYKYWQSRNRCTVMLALTYNDDHLPRTKLGTPTLRQKDVQLFMKRLRKDLQKQQIFCRFFYCGEYGPGTQRPHYHMLLFGLPADWSNLKIRQLLEGHWKNGFVLDGLDKVRGLGGIHYCTKYMINKALRLNDPDCEKPFNRCSKGLGISFLFNLYEDKNGIHKGSKCYDPEDFKQKISDVDVESLYRYLIEDVLVSGDERKAYEFATWIHAHYRDRVKLSDYRRKIPRYLRTKIFNGVERYLINWADAYLYFMPKEKEYKMKYLEYDLTHDVPMRVLQGMEKEKRLISSYVKNSVD